LSEPRFNDPLTSQIAAFLSGIGIRVHAREITEATLFPGMKIEFGDLVIDETKLRHPGDLLHEAGHIAVFSPEERKAVNGDAGPDAAAEMAATGWSYAAVVHLGLDPSVIFHAESFQGGARSMIENFTHGHYLGVPMLQWYGLTADAKRAAELGVKPYPFLLRWLR
jgi:hypothetical protein